MVGFGILSSVMYAKFVVSEYMGKGLLLLFSYPIKRSHILFAKCSLVFCFTVVMMIVCNMITLSGFGLISNIFHFIKLPFNLSVIVHLMKTTLILALLSASIGTVAMRIGFWKKSVPVTIVTAVIIASPCSNLVSFALDQSGSVMISVMLILLTIGIAAFIGIARKVNQMEAV